MHFVHRRYVLDTGLDTTLSLSRRFKWVRCASADKNILSLLFATLGGAKFVPNPYENVDNTAEFH